MPQRTQAKTRRTSRRTPAKTRRTETPAKTSRRTPAKTRRMSQRTPAKTRRTSRRTPAKTPQPTPAKTRRRRREDATADTGEDATADTGEDATADTSADTGGERFARGAPRQPDRWRGRPRCSMWTCRRPSASPRSRSVGMRQAPNDPDTLYVIEKAGRLRAFELDAASPSGRVVLDIQSRVNNAMVAERRARQVPRRRLPPGV